MEKIKDQATPTNNIEDIRAVATLLTAKINNMCNAKTTDEIAASFVEAKDYLIKLYTLNINKVIQ